MGLENKVVVVTGGASGIGRAAALQFAKQGARLVLASRDELALLEVVVECTRLGGRALAVPTDVTDAEQVFELARRAVAAEGRIDVWVNDAAVYLLGRFDEVPLPAHRRVIETNLLGVIYGAHAAMAQFRAQGHGVLINIGSAACNGYRYAASYCASKLAVRGLSQALRQEVLGSRIHVCAVLPATVDTPLFQHAANYTGREVVAMPPVQSAERVARAIVSCARHPRRELEVGATPSWVGFAQRRFPALWERLQARTVDKSHLGHERAFTTDGNLFHPTGSHVVSGGWRSGGRKLLGALVGLGAIGLATFGGLRALRA